MVARINTVAFHGIEVQDVDMQVQISNGLPVFAVAKYIIFCLGRMAKISFLLPFLILFTSAEVNAENQKHVDYRWISKKAHALVAMTVNNGITVFGSRSYFRFDDKIIRVGGHAGPTEEHFSGPLKFEGYAQFIKPLSDQKVIVAGLDYKAKSLSSLLAKDERRNFILKMDSQTLEVQKFLPLDDRVSYGLAVDKNNQIALLSGEEHGHYTLTVFNSDLKRIKSARFGVGEKAMSLLPVPEIILP